VTGVLNKHQMAAKLAQDIPSGSFVNLGIGQPTLVADYLQPSQSVILHTENGLLNMGRAARPDEIDEDLVNAGKIPVTELPGASYFDTVDSFALMRGGHLDVCVLGAFQVSASGDLANWLTNAPDAIPSVGGAMELAIGAKRVFVLMTLLTKEGRPKLVPECTYPLTGVGCVDRIYTDYATFEISPDGVRVLATYGITFDELATLLDVPVLDATDRTTPAPVTVRS
jgi:3-oxoadipate CoA-transferase beta subunit